MPSRVSEVSEIFRLFDRTFDRTNVIVLLFPRFTIPHSIDGVVTKEERLETSVIRGFTGFKAIFRIASATEPRIAFLKSLAEIFVVRISFSEKEFDRIE